MCAWLEGDSRRRLLILLDESDGFFEADSTQFPETNRLKDLGQMPGFESRTKVVFAGLHSVPIPRVQRRTLSTAGWMILA